ncbi:MAG TPA: serine/threonine-protein kinase, partial [Saprospiraceae bacterium]|nr:serine/threonine-protein kinase [Saprospiraceae bacterium]
PKGSFEPVSVKMLNEIKKSREMLQNEIEIHSKLAHPNIVQYIDSFTTKSCYEEKEIILSKESDGTCDVLILEMCPNKSVREMLKLRKRLLPEEAVFIVKEIANALLYLKKKNLIHRDVKPENIMLCSDMSVKLADFGLAIAQGSKTNIAGTPNYIAPEMLLGEGYSYPLDMWALGCTFYTLLYRTPPFQTSSMDTTFRRIKEGIWYFRDVIIVPEPIKNIITKMLIKSPNDRISVDDFLKDPIIQKCSLKRLPFESRALKPDEDILTKCMIPNPTEPINRSLSLSFKKVSNY